MQAILPGSPNSKLQAIDCGLYDGKTILVYISGQTLVILDGPQSIVQTICHDDLQDDSLCAVIYHKAIGKIATASSRKIFIYSVREDIKGTPEWRYDSIITIAESDGCIECLSWGSDEELLVGSRTLKLFSTHVPRTAASPALAKVIGGVTQPIWCVPLASTVHYAAFSPSASLIASTSAYDCLVKIWRRLSFESAEFEYAYLRHPGVVTHVEWRNPGCKTDSGARDEDDTLLTICADGRVRIWVNDEAHRDILLLFAEIDTISAIQPRNNLDTDKSNDRYVFMVPWPNLEIVSAIASSTSKDRKDKHAMEYIREITSRRPDIIVVLDSRGHMSAWGIENVGCRRRNSAPTDSAPFLISHAENVQCGPMQSLSATPVYAKIMSLASPEARGHINIFWHHYDGQLLWQSLALQNLFNNSAKKDRVEQLALLSGHGSAVKYVACAAEGQSIMTISHDDEVIVWKKTTSTTTPLRRHSIVATRAPIRRSLLLAQGSILVLLHDSELSIWDTQTWHGREITTCKHSLGAEVVAFVASPVGETENSILVLAFTSNGSCKSWILEVELGRGMPRGDLQVSLKDLHIEQLDTIDAAMSITSIDCTNDRINDGNSWADVLSCDGNGLLQTIEAKLLPHDRVVALARSQSVETGIQNILQARASNENKAALISADRSILTIFDLRTGHLEHEQTFTDQTILDTAWTSTARKQSLLAVGFAHHVTIMAQLRYDFFTAQPAWTKIRDIDVRNYTDHAIGAFAWCSDGSLCIGAGNALFMTPSTVDTKIDTAPDAQAMISLQDSGKVGLLPLVDKLNGALPVFHPSFLVQCIFFEKLDFVHFVLARLYSALKFYTEGDDLDDELDIESTALQRRLAARQEPSNDHDQQEDGEMKFDAETFDLLAAVLKSKQIRSLTHKDQAHLAMLVECISKLQQHQHSIDKNAMKFLFSNYMHTSLESIHRDPETTAPEESINHECDWRNIVWAKHSSSQDILVDLLYRQHNGRLTWQDAKATGLFSWLSDHAALVAQFENIARHEYRATEPNNPVICSLYYLALHKKQILIGLWRMATWSREQAPTVKLLRNDFSDSRWRTAAAKNAYALMGKRRFEYAAAFFLLAEDLASAVSVLSNQLGDIQLAIAVARVHGGDDGPVFRSLLETAVLPMAIEAGDRWHAIWAFEMLNDRRNASRAASISLHSLAQLSASGSIARRSRSFRRGDPTMIMAYKELGISKTSSNVRQRFCSEREEWDYVIKTTMTLCRAGCHQLALDLVCGWNFASTSSDEVIRQDSNNNVDQKDNASTHAGDSSTSSRAVASMLDEFEDQAGSGAAGSKKLEVQKPAQFKEAEANSLLDSFGF